MAQNNTINGQQQAGSAPPSLVEQFLQDQLLQRGHMTKASLRSQLAKVQNTMDKTRNTRAQLLPRMADRTLFTSALRRIFSNR